MLVRMVILAKNADGTHRIARDVSKIFPVLKGITCQMKRVVQNVAVTPREGETPNLTFVKMTVSEFRNIFYNSLT